MDLTGKWRYIENYGYGVAEGELYLKQKGQTLAGRIVFTDKVEGESWFGLLVDDNTIKGVSKDGQGVEGYFEFEKVATSLPMEI